MTKFTDFFKDRNDINEKTVIGFISFIIMFVFAMVDLVSGMLGKELVIHEYIFNSFLMLTLGVFGISSVDKYINKRHSGSDRHYRDDDSSSEFSPPDTADDFNPDEDLPRRN